MKTKLLQRLSTLLLLILLLGCRNENIYSSDDSEHQKDEFFAKLSQSLSNYPDGKKIIERIKQENQKSNFLEKINKRNGEAKLDQKILKKSFQLDKTGKSEDSIIYLNVPFGNSNYLTSVLFIEFSSTEFKVNEIDNIKLEEIVNDNSLSRESREELLINYLILDKSQYNSNEYINIPSALFPELKENTGTLSKSFKILNYTISPADSSSGRIGDTVVCIEYEDSCDHCSGLPTNWMCYSFGGGGGDDDGGNDGGGTGTGGNPGGDGGGSGGGDGTGTGNENPENPDPCTDRNSPWYTHSSCGNSYPSSVLLFSQKMNGYGFNITEYLQFLTDNSSVRIDFANYLNSNNNQQGADIIMAAIKFWFTNPDTINPNQLPNRISDLNNASVQNPDLLLDIPCDKLPLWQDVSKYQIPQSVKNKINSIPNQNSYWSSWAVTSLDDGAGARVNMDLFPVKINSLPNKPGTNQQYTAAEFFDFFRKNINLFAEKFEPIEDNYFNIHDTALWNSSNPLGALIHINIPIDDGTVICSGFSSNTWIFTTIKAPLSWSYDGIHPVAGNRKFSYYTDPNDGSVTIYTRGVDRLSNNNDNDTPLLNFLMESTAFTGADELWEGMQAKLFNYVNLKGGAATIISPEKHRPNYSGISEYLKGKAPIRSLGCK